MEIKQGYEDIDTWDMFMVHYYSTFQKFYNADITKKRYEEYKRDYIKFSQVFGKMFEEKITKDMHEWMKQYRPALFSAYGALHHYFKNPSELYHFQAVILIENHLKNYKKECTECEVGI